MDSWMKCESLALERTRFGLELELDLELELEHGRALKFEVEVEFKLQVELEQFEFERHLKRELVGYCSNTKSNLLDSSSISN